MLELDLIFAKHDDPPPWAEALADIKRVHHLPDAIWHVVVLEGGMQSGKPSIALRLDLENGECVVAESSVQLFSQIVVACRAKYPELFAGGPLDPTADTNPLGRTN